MKANIVKAHRRDDDCCRFCGFKSKQFQRVIPFAEAGDPPLATVCTFCDLVLNLERAGMTGSSLLIWLPEINQIDLNHLARAIYVARAAKGPMAALATRALDALTARRAEAKKRLGSDDPLLLATIMREQLDGEEMQKAVAKLDGIRLLPSEKYLVRGPKGDANQLPTMVRYWTSSGGPFASLPVDSWHDNFKKAIAATATA